MSRFLDDAILNTFVSYMKGKLKYFMPKYTYDKKANKLVQSDKRFRAEHVPENQWTPVSEENWPGDDLETLYKSHGYPMGDRDMFDNASDNLINMSHSFPEPPPDAPSPLPTDLKFNEDQYLGEVQDYVVHTYGEHYAKGNVQTFELIASSGHADGFTMGNIMKLASRYGKKDGYNRKDLFKIIHYCILELWVHDNANRQGEK